MFSTTHIKTIVFGSSICDDGVEALRKGLKCECVQALEIASTNVMEVIKMNIKPLTVDISSSIIDTIITISGKSSYCLIQ